MTDVVAAIQPTWPRPPAQVTLQGAEVHVWAAQLDAPSAALGERWVSQEERERANRFVHAAHRSRYLAGRGILRGLLGIYLSCPPWRVQLAEGPHGKPMLSDHASALQFNISHSGGLMLAAFATQTRLGVDVELETPRERLEALVTSTFSPTESREILSLTGDKRLRAFYDMWTVKEALVKAVGLGLSVPLDSFRVELPDEDSPNTPTLARLDTAGERSDWRVYRLLPAIGFRGALALEGLGNASPFCWTLPCPETEAAHAVTGWDLRPFWPPAE